MSYQKKEDSDGGEQVSNWKGCCAQMCDIPPSINAGGNQYCTYHHGFEYEYFDAITAAIKNNMEHYNYMLTLMRWDNKRWRQAWGTVTKYHFLPMREDEHILPHRYVERLSKHLREVINSEAGL